MFPEELPKRLIKMFSFVGETILDPFVGSGTTSLAAKNLQRNSIGYEINESFLPIITKKIGAEQGNIFNPSKLEVVRGSVQEINEDEEIRNLPYIFHDPIQLDKKIDPRSMTFESKINKNTQEKQSYSRLKRVLSPNLMELTNDIVIRLIGIREKSGAEEKAMEWLSKKLKDQNFLLKFDEVKHDKKDRLLSYLYLQNNAFINLHLLRTHWVEVDESFPFKYRDKFKDISTKVRKKPPQRIG